MRVSRIQALLLVALLGALLATAIRAPSRKFRKQNQGPPSEFANFTLPDPQLAAQRSSLALVPVKFQQDPNSQTFSWSGKFPVDSTTEFAFGLFSPYEQELKVVLTQPTASGGTVTLCLSCLAHANNGASSSFLDNNNNNAEDNFVGVTPVIRHETFGFDGATYPLTTYAFTNPLPGTWSAELQLASAPADQEYQAALVLYNDSPVKLFSHLNSFELELDQEIGLVANLYDEHSSPLLGGEDNERPMALQLVSVSAEMEVTFPDGREVQIPMHDDGAHFDLGASDGVYGAVLQASESGTYTAQSIIRGTTADGQAFFRTAEHVFAVVSPDATLTGLASSEYKADEQAMYFHIDVDVLHPSSLDAQPLTLKAYAEVWGTDHTGLEYTPVAWMQSMVDVEIVGQEHVLSMYLHEDWIHKASASAPFQLRNVWIQNRDTNALMSSRAVVYVDSEAHGTLRTFRLKPSRKHAPISEEMRVGPRPLSLRSNATVTAGKGTLLLVHGYCATVNEFPTEHFTNAVQFKDYKASRSNDEFALMIKEFGDQFPSFSIVAHSQGGLASTHLHAYYWSNLENAQGGRLIQSVGSPYQGSGLAGGLADVGEWFGVGCGTNTDLSYDGAVPWQNALPPTPRDDVYYYTTQYDGGWLDGYCVYGASLALYSPNDGTTEIEKASLKGGHEAGTKTGWCHTTEMKFPPQCGDKERNTEMNANAAR